MFPWYCVVAGTQSDEQKRADREYEFWGLMLFVGIPLPGTGAWTGAGGIPAPHEIWQGIWRDFSRYRAGDGDYVDSVPTACWACCLMMAQIKME